MNNPQGVPRRKLKYVGGGDRRIPLTTTAHYDIVVLVNPDGTFCASYNGAGGVGLRIDQSCLDIPRKSEEGLFNTLVNLGRRLHELDTKLLSKFPSLLFCNDPFVIPVRLVSDQDLVYSFGSVLLDVGVPRTDIVKRSLVSDVVDEQNSHGAPVVRNGNGTEPFLASSVPDLEFDSFSVEFNGAYLEVDTDCGDE